MAKAEKFVKKEPVKDFFKDVVFVLVAFFFLNSFVLASFEVPTGSMENEILAPHDCTVEEIHAIKGTSVNAGDPLIVLA